MNNMHSSKHNTQELESNISSTSNGAYHQANSTTANTSKIHPVAHDKHLEIKFAKA